MQVLRWWYKFNQESWGSLFSNRMLAKEDFDKYQAFAINTVWYLLEKGAKGKQSHKCKSWKFRDIKGKEIVQSTGLSWGI